MVQPLDAFLSKPEQRLLQAVALRPEQDFGTLELMDRMGSSRSAGSTLLQRWVDAGLLKERRVGNQRRLSINPDFLLYREIRQMALKTVAMAEPLARALAPCRQRLSQAFIFGSVAAGTDSSASDIDLAVVGSVDLFTLSPLLDVVQSELGRSIHLNLYTDEEWNLGADPVLASIKAGPRLDIMEVINAQTH